MKNTFLLLIAFVFSISVKGQIFLENTYIAPPNDFTIIKLQYSGYKYCTAKLNDTISLYNLDHTVFKKIPLPSLPSGLQNVIVAYITETLFDTDSSDIEYLINYQDGLLGYGAWYTRVYDESGTLLFSADSSQLQNINASLPAYRSNSSGIYNTDSGAKMILIRDAMDLTTITSVYNLPGLLECTKCDGQRSTNTGITSGGINTDFKVFPNPSNGFSLVQYELPADAEQANLILFDVSGRELRRFAVDKSSARLMLPTAEFAQGTYFYALDIPGKGLTTKKVLIIH